MGSKYQARWHKTSYDRLIDQQLPELLSSRLRLLGYQAEVVDTYVRKVTVTVASTPTATSTEGQVTSSYELPAPDEDGVFKIPSISDHPRVVIPTVSSAALKAAEVKCVGEQLYSHLADRLGQAPDDLAWDEHVMQAWLPLADWVMDFFAESETSQPHEKLNWLSAREHCRRVRFMEDDLTFNPEQFGRVCPVMMPEGPHITRIRYVALGAEIRDGGFAILDESPVKGLSIGASLIPFCEHTDRNRRLMGANMMRQWLVPDDPEPALVQTGVEPDAPGFWGGRNLLTAFITWDGSALEDGIVMSESGAARFGYPWPLEIGDKISNRHGMKGCVSRILPDEDMPKMADGTTIELICSSAGTLSRLVMGQLKEAAMSRIARAEGAAAIVPPFGAPTVAEMRERLTANGLPENGMETLTLHGKSMDRTSTAGWVYWGKTFHLAADKIHAISQSRPGKDDPSTTIKRQFVLDKLGTETPAPWMLQGKSPNLYGYGMRQGDGEYWAMRDLGAYEYIRETFNMRDELTDYLFYDADEDAPDRHRLVERIMAGPVNTIDTPSPKFLDLQRRMTMAGIYMDVEQDRITFRFDRPAGERLTLQKPIPHPWLNERELTEIGLSDRLPLSQQVADANAKLSQLAEGRMPAFLVEKAETDLAVSVTRYLDSLCFTNEASVTKIRITNRVRFSGKSIIIPNGDLHYDQIGIPEEMAWVLFGPMVAREQGQNAVVDRTQEANKGLDRVMATQWVVINRAPTNMVTNICAFRPVRMPAYAVQVHPFFCPLMNADFDGDQVAVFLPITAAAQLEASERLSVAAHVRHDPSLIGSLVPTHDGMWGLASHSLTRDGLEQINGIAGVTVAMPDGYITRTTLGQAMEQALKNDGVDTALEALERLIKLGYEVARGAGASMSPFTGISLDRSMAPAGNDPDAWTRYAEQLSEQTSARTDFDDSDLGFPLLLAKSEARGNMLHIRRWIGAAGNFVDENGTRIPVKTGLSEGYAPEVMRSEILGSHRGLIRLSEDMADLGRRLRTEKPSRHFTPMARALRSPNPGIVFARAAAIGEVDPLTDLDTRLFMGLPISDALASG